jgi:hypothetical protein
MHQMMALAPGDDDFDFGANSTTTTTFTIMECLDDDDYYVSTPPEHMMASIVTRDWRDDVQEEEQQQQKQSETVVQAFSFSTSTSSSSALCPTEITSTITHSITETASAHAATFSIPLSASSSSTSASASSSSSDQVHDAPSLPSLPSNHPLSSILDPTQERLVLEKDPLGEGGFGKVFLGHIVSNTTSVPTTTTTTKPDVAVKVIPYDPEDLRDGIPNEAYMHSRTPKHPNILQFHCVRRQFDSPVIHTHLIVVVLTNISLCG